MSLINNALKKAQRQRAAEAETTAIGPDTPLRRGKSMPAQTLILLGTGAAVIVVLSVVVTVYLLRPSPVATPQNNVVPVQLTTAPSTAEIIFPVIKISNPEVTEAAPITNDTAPHSAPETIPADAPANAVAATATIAQPIAPEPARADERIYAFIDNLQVMGVRSSGADSKVLMNDRVYRVNDIVDRTLALRLVKVAPDQLVFEDANGITYAKTF